jgi:hypothetical protein
LNDSFDLESQRLTVTRRAATEMCSLIVGKKICDKQLKAYVADNVRRFLLGMTSTQLVIPYLQRRNPLPLVRVGSDFV